MKALFFDLETTGVKHWENGIHQISGILEVDGEIKEKIDIKVQPFNSDKVEDEALAIGNVTRDMLKTYMVPSAAHKEFVDVLQKYVDRFNRFEKYFLIGYNNASFDNQFLRQFFGKNHDKYFGSYFWSSSIDVMVLAAQHLKERRGEMRDFKLMTVAKELGLKVDEEQLHDAMYDIKLTRQIYNLVTDRLEKVEEDGQSVLQFNEPKEGVASEPLEVKDEGQTEKLDDLPF